MILDPMCGTGAIPLEVRPFLVGVHTVCDNCALPNVSCSPSQRAPLSFPTPSTSPVTTMTWQLTAHTITPVTSRNDEKTKAGEFGGGVHSVC